MPCHAINEYEEVKLLVDLGHDVLSQGAYANPRKPGDNARPAIPNAPVHEDLIPLLPKKWYEVIHEDLIKWADVIWILGLQDWLPPNWERMKHKIVIFRSIGQSIPHTESVLKRYRPDGLKIVRYSPYERTIPGFCGEDALIRFYKDETVYNGWVGNIPQVITIAQSMKYRGQFLKYDVFERSTRFMPRKLYGRGNPVEGFSCGELSFDEMLKVLRENRVFFYTCTFPAQYTMAFQEAFMTGIPVVAIGKNLAGFNIEVPDIIENGVSGFTSNNIPELRSYVKKLLDDYELAKTISKNGRKKACELFAYQPIKEAWRKFLNELEGSR